MSGKQEKELTSDLLALPLPLLQMILVQGTSLIDKKALRQTCKLFQEVLDNNVTCISLRANSREGQHQQRFLKRMQRVQGLTRIALTYADDMLKHLPEQITTLSVQCCEIDLFQLIKMQSLASLEIYADEICNMEYISGLTRLHVTKPCGSVAHLASTLRHLNINEYDNVEDMDQLTSMKVLEVQDRYMPANFFQTHRHLPLKHLCLNTQWYKSLYRDAKGRIMAPATLTRLTLYGSTSAYDSIQKRPIDGLPINVTHLQLLNGHYEIVDPAALSGIKQLDLGLDRWFPNYHNSILNCLTTLSNLQSMRVCAITLFNMQKEEILVMLPDVKKAVERGVNVNVVRCFSEILDDLEFPCPAQSEWSSSA